LLTDNLAGVTSQKPPTVEGMLTLKHGLFTDTGLSMATGSTIKRMDGAISTAPTFGTSMDLIYGNTDGGIASGPELPTASTVLKNLTINNTLTATLKADPT